ALLGPSEARLETAAPPAGTSRQAGCSGDSGGLRPQLLGGIAVALGAAAYSHPLQPAVPGSGPRRKCRPHHVEGGLAAGTVQDTGPLPAERQQLSKLRTILDAHPVVCRHARTLQ